MRRVLGVLLIGLGATVVAILAVPSASAIVHTCTYNFADTTVPPVNCPAPIVASPGDFLEFQFREKSWPVLGGAGPCWTATVGAAGDQCVQHFTLTRRVGAVSTVVVDTCLRGVNFGPVTFWSGGASQNPTPAGDFPLSAGQIWTWTLSPAMPVAATTLTPPATTSPTCGTPGGIHWERVNNAPKYAGIAIVSGTGGGSPIQSCGPGEVGIYVLNVGICEGIFTCGPTAGRLPSYGYGSNCDCFGDEGGNSQDRGCVPGFGGCEGAGAQDPNNGNTWYFAMLCNGPDGIYVCVGSVTYGSNGGAKTYAVDALCAGKHEDCYGVWQLERTRTFDTGTKTWTDSESWTPFYVNGIPTEICP